MVFKSLNGLAPEYLSSNFIARFNTTSYTFRDSVNTNYPTAPTVVLCCGIVFLKHILRQAESLSNFKSLLHSYYNIK